jgi:hypothetical protein
MVREARDEASVEVDKADKGLHLLFVKGTTRNLSPT